VTDAVCGASGGPLAGPARLVTTWAARQAMAQVQNAAAVRWWHDVGGDAVTFGSDAHDPAGVASRFLDDAHLAEAHGFRPGRDPHDFWARID